MPAYRAVVVGAGGISRAWFPPLAEEKVEVAAVVDLDRERAEAAIDTYALPRAIASDDLARTLRDTDADFAVDLTVPEAHAEVTCACLRAGLHVIGEKPMASSMAEARRMVRAAEKADRLYMCSQSRRWEPRHDAAARTVAGGKVGRLTTVNCDFFLQANFGGFRAEMPSPLILDMAIHHFDLARMMSGADPVAVYAEEFNPPDSWSQGDNAANCIFEMTGGVYFVYRGSWCAKGCPTSWNGNWRLIGTKGTLLYEQDEPAHGEAVTSKTKGHRGPHRKIRVTKSPIKKTYMHGALAEMLRFLKTGRAPQTEGHDNIKSLAMVFAAMESSRKRRRVPVRAL
jgi:predicted dehydrogenase